MKTSIYEADPFSGSKADHFFTIDTDYRFEKNDELWLEVGDESTKVRVTWVHVSVRDDGYMERDLLVLKL